jgi:hypothetical protein
MAHKSVLTNLRDLASANIGTTDKEYVHRFVWPPGIIPSRALGFLILAPSVRVTGGKKGPAFFPSAPLRGWACLEALLLLRYFLPPVFREAL